MEAQSSMSGKAVWSRIPTSVYAVRGSGINPATGRKVTQYFVLLNRDEAERLAKRAQAFYRSESGEMVPVPAQYSLIKGEVTWVEVESV